MSHQSVIHRSGSYLLLLTFLLLPASVRLGPAEGHDPSVFSPSIDRRTFFDERKADAEKDLAGSAEPPAPELVRVEPGTFVMGRLTGTTAGELAARYGGRESSFAEPAGAHPVTLTRPFLVGRYEVTNAEFAAVYNWAFQRGYGRVVQNETLITFQNSIGDSRILMELQRVEIRYSETVDGEIRENPGIQVRNGSISAAVGTENAPVSFVSWCGAVCWCNWLSEIQGLTPCYDLDDWSCDFEADGFRLPTEAEWEFAARGGLQSRGCVFAGGNELDDVAWWRGNAGRTSSRPVGGRMPNEMGLFDMSGNVCEFCFDWYATYEGRDLTNPVGPSTGRTRVMRGGGWDFPSNLACIVTRDHILIEYCNRTIGFRACRTAD